MSRARPDRCNIFGNTITLFCRAVDKLYLEGTPPDDGTTASIVGQIRLIERLCEEEGFAVSPATMGCLRSVYVAPYVNFARIRVKGNGVVGLEDGDGEADSDELEVAATLDPRASTSGTSRTHVSIRTQRPAEGRIAQVTAPPTIPPAKRGSVDVTDADPPRKRARMGDAAAPVITPHLISQLLPSPSIPATASKSTPSNGTVRPLIIVKRVNPETANTAPARKRARINEVSAPVFVQSGSKTASSGHTVPTTPRSPSPALSTSESSSGSDPTSFNTTFPTASRAKQKPQRILPVDRKTICLYHKESPTARQADIARIYGVDPGTIGRILKDKARWLHGRAPADEMLNAGPVSQVGQYATPAAAPAGTLPDSPRRASLRSQQHDAESTAAPSVENNPAPLVSQVSQCATPAAVPAGSVSQPPDSPRRASLRSQQHNAKSTAAPTAESHPAPRTPRLAAPLVSQVGQCATPAAAPVGALPDAPRRASLRSQQHNAESPSAESNPTPLVSQIGASPAAAPAGALPDAPRRASLRSQQHIAEFPSVERNPAPRTPRRAGPGALAPPAASPIEASVDEPLPAHKRGRPRLHPRPFPIALTPSPPARAGPSPTAWSRHLAAAVAEAEADMASTTKARRLAEQAVDSAVEAQLVAAWNLSRKKAALAEWEA